MMRRSFSGPFLQVKGEQPCNSLLAGQLRSQLRIPPEESVPTNWPTAWAGFPRGSAFRPQFVFAVDLASDRIR